MTTIEDETVLEHALEGRADACELVAACSTGKSDKGPYIAALIERAGSRLVEIEWQPGKGFSVRGTPLKGKVPEGIFDGSMAGDRIIFSDEDDQVFAMSRVTGEVCRVPLVSAPVVIGSTGNWIVAATGSGLLSVGLRGGDGKAPLEAGDVQPVYCGDLDNPCGMTLRPAGDARLMELTIGCYGAVERIALRADPDGNSRLEAIEKRSVSLEQNLTYDPIWVSMPILETPAAFGPYVFAMNDVATGAVAIAAATDAVTACPDQNKEYGSMPYVAPGLDGEACLVRPRDGVLSYWVPGTEPRPVRPIDGRILMWAGTGALVIPDDDPVIREVPLRT